MTSAPLEGISKGGVCRRHAAAGRVAVLASGGEDAVVILRLALTQLADARLAAAVERWTAEALVCTGRFAEAAARIAVDGGLPSARPTEP